MKKQISIAVLLLFAVLLRAQVHISIDEPDSLWTAQKALGDYIGQTVIFDDPIVVCSNANSSSLVVSPWRMFQPLCQGVIGSNGYHTAAHVNSTCRMALTGVSGYHRCGEKVYNLKVKVNSTNNLSFISGEWRGNTRSDLQAGLPDLGDYRLLVCAMNLENYFMTLGEMGAKTEAQRQRQRTKVSKALAKINADIYGLVELQQGNEAIAEIVSDLNKNLPNRQYKYFTEGGSGTMQKSDYVYDANMVEPIGLPVEINAELAYRKKMICFREKSTGEKFIYSINHFKAMNSGSAEIRSREAAAVLDRYKTYRANPNIDDKDLLLMGDLNTYAFTDPIFIFLDHGMLDLHRAFHADSSYSYMFGGLASYIDHAICSETLFRQVTGMAVYTINSDESDEFTYDKSTDNTMFRSSDHDPVLVGLKLDESLSIPIEPNIDDRSWGKDSVSLYCVYTPMDENPLVYFDIYTVDGFQVCPPTKMEYQGTIEERHVKYYTLSAENPNLPKEIKQLLPLPSGIYILHFYYKGKVTAHKFIIR